MLYMPWAPRDNRAAQRDMTEGYLGFEPKDENGRYLVSVSNTWGEVFFTKEECRLSLYGAPLALSAFSLPFPVGRVTADGIPLSFAASGDRIAFSRTSASEWRFLRA